MLHVASAEAQLNNKPFSFNTPDGGPGMSFAAKQAIMNLQLYNATPDNIMRGPGGGLLTITRNDRADGVPIVTTESGEEIPGFRGRGLDLGGLLLEPTTGIGSGDGGQLLLGFGSSSGITVTTWTYRLVVATTGGGYPSFGGGYGFGGSGQSINTWTAQVFGLAGG
jgi:hypothetical protein